jgi:hypothetical protein
MGDGNMHRHVWQSAVPADGYIFAKQSISKRQRMCSEKSMSMCSPFFKIYVRQIPLGWAAREIIDRN